MKQKFMLFWSLLLLAGCTPMHQQFHVVFDDVTGLPLGSPVMVKDHPVGLVTQVKLGPQLEPIVTIQLDDPYRFSIDSRLVIEEPLNSPPLVHILPGASEEMIRASDTIVGINLIKHRKDSALNSINQMVNQYEHTLNARDSVQHALESSHGGLPEPTPEHLE